MYDVAGERSDLDSVHSPITEPALCHLSLISFGLDFTIENRIRQKTLLEKRS